MSGPTTVIAGHDGTSSGFDAIAHAVEIAASKDAHVLVLHVIEHQMPFTSQDVGYQRQQRDRVAEVFEPVHEQFGSAVETRIISAASPPAGLRDSAKEEGAAVVVVGPSHHGPVGHVLYGHVANWLTSHCDCDVEVAPVGKHAVTEAGARQQS